ncbi:MAG: peptidoglycan DD-metalloendopeptidase family protein [Casimicrobiaceae bacterium]
MNPMFHPLQFDAALRDLRSWSIALGLLMVLLLTGCTASRPAPVVDRTQLPPTPGVRPEPPRVVQPSVPPQVTSPAPVAAPAAPPARIASPLPASGVHIVQRGENLYRIALNYGLDMHALAAWNGMTTATPLREGQSLRLTPPPGGVAALPAPGTPAPAPIIAQPLPPLAAPQAPLSSPPGAPPAPVVADVPVRREPRAQRVPFSESALAEMQREGRPAPGPSESSPPGGTAAVTGSAFGATASGAASTAYVPATGGEPEVRPGAGVDREGVRWTWPTTGRVVTRFNERAPLKGIEIAAAVGTPVVAAAAGKVIFVGNELRGCGQMVVISHGEGVVSVYCHLGKIAVREQQRVMLGQRIAEVGDTGNARLHFEIRRQGRPLDPIALMPK